VTERNGTERNRLCSSLLCRVMGFGYDLQLGVFPKVVRIETTNACNAECVICPHRKMTRPVRRLDEALYRAIIDECSSFACKEVHLHNFGEPLLDTRLEMFIGYAKSKGIPRVKIFSNGSLLSEERAKGLIEAGLDEIKISFDGASKEEFEAIRLPLKFDEIVENIFRLVDLRNRQKSMLKVRVACCSTSNQSETMALLGSRVDSFSFGKIHNWGTEGYETRAVGVRKPCSRVWRTLTILASGDVSLCCLDYDGQVNLGRVDASNRIAAIWRSSAYKRIRQLHKRARQDEVPLCAHCSKAFL